MEDGSQSRDVQGGGTDRDSFGFFGIFGIFSGFLGILGFLKMVPSHVTSKWGSSQPGFLKSFSICLRFFKMFHREVM